MKILVTGAAGFVGYHLTQRLLAEGIEVVGMDNVNDYYDVQLKKDRLSLLDNEKFTFYKLDLANKEQVFEVFEKHSIHTVINLAAQAGVRYSLENPYAYIDSNITGFVNILEACRHHEIKHLIYASSSSVYGANTKMPFSVEDKVDYPVSLYAATKKSNELMAHTYSHLYGIPVTGLRFFTVYGPWGRPDMAYFSFTKNILEGKTIKVFNNGKMKRDFTYIDDIVEGIVRLTNHIPETETVSTLDEGYNSKAKYRVFNIGNNQPENLMDFIHILENHLGKKANIEFMPMQPGDVEATYADIKDLTDAVGFKPSTSLNDGLEKFVAWYKDYYKV
ncbi:NAD-dependent epimerase [Sutcliffiella deserti]|uniref:NAD-dependent epimerase n=1 Tax=Sutcliffiella deserti TaxID=2875501 RepID=UPI001CC12093|nr:NAD-dependent epimerase [Sutcliffiella deserti]